MHSTIHRNICLVVGLIPLLIGCSHIVETTRETVVHDTTVIYVPMPILIDTTVNPDSSGSFTASGKDTTGSWSIMYNGILKKLKGTITPRVDTVRIPISVTNTSQTKLSMPFTQKLGWGALGALALAGILILLKGFKIF
jgi:hypothetical protein